MQKQQPSMIGPALIGGGVFGFLSGVPLVGALNCMCCALVVAGGFVAAYLYSRPCKDAGVPFAAGNGALVGLIAGVIHAVVATVVSALAQLALGAGDWQQMMDQFGSQMDPAAMEQVSRFMESTGPVVMVLIGLLMWLLAGTVFSTIGGAIGGAVFKQEPPAAPPAMIPPPCSDPPPPPPVGPGA